MLIALSVNKNKNLYINSNSIKFKFFNKIKLCFKLNKLSFFFCDKNYIYALFRACSINFISIFIYFKISFLRKKNYSRLFFKPIGKLKRYFKFFKLIYIFKQIILFNKYTINAKVAVLTNLKKIFFKAIFRDTALKSRLSLVFFETKKIEYLTANLVTNYIVRSLKVGHSLNRIIYPLLRNLERARIYSGWKIGCNGRFKRRGRAQRVWFGRQGVSLNTITSCTDFGQQIVRLRNGVCCIKVFLVHKNQYVYNL